MENNNEFFEKLLRELSENYLSIFYVDFDNDTVEPYRLNAEIEDAFGDFFKTKPTYEEAMNNYISRVVSDKDQDEMRRLTSYAHLSEYMKKSKAFAHEYRLERHGRERVFRFKAANLEGVGELHRAVVGFADVNAEKVADFKYYQRGKKILSVEDNALNREILENILSDDYDVISVGNGLEALNILNEQYEDIAVVITDINMPVMDGYGLIENMKNTRQLSSIPIIVATSTEVMGNGSKEAVEIKCLEMGASDFVLKPYNPKIILNRISSVIRLRESVTLLNTLERDVLTGLYSKEMFYRCVEQYLKAEKDTDFILWVTDIEGLKLINDNHGIAAGDKVLLTLANYICSMKEFLIGGRIEGDKFAFLMSCDAMEKVETMAQEANYGIDFGQIKVSIKSGVYRTDKNSTLKAQEMYDRAILALDNIKPIYGHNMAEYDDELRNRLLTQRMVLDNAEIGLSERQFVVYYQPKYDLRRERLCGAEALIRWIHPELGFMNPGVFIPIFERNGYISRVDSYVWEEVCRTLKSWKDSGKAVVPVSVNASRRDFDDPLMAEHFIEMVDSYGLEHHLIHMEITESAYSDNEAGILSAIKKLHDSGFVIELDDFGSGYSSMVALAEMPIDILKVDMSIVHADTPDADKSVLAMIMKLAQMMNVSTVSEGVETEAQAERIRKLGGDYIQGYFFSKPLPRDDFERFMENKKQ